MKTKKIPAQPSFFRFILAALRVLGQSLLSTVVLLLLLEGICTLAGLPQGESSFVQGVVMRQGLSSRKPKDEIRIFAYGESTIHGAQYAPISSIPQWLAEYVKDFLPGKNVRFVNFGRMGQGPYFTYETFRDTLDYKPDYAIFYTGHNAMIPGNRVDQVMKKISKPGYVFKQGMRKSRFISAVYRKITEIRMKREPHKFPDDSIEFKRIETYPSGYSEDNQVIRNTPYYQENMKFFEKNLDQILDLARGRKIPVLFMMPVSNLKDLSPLSSTHIRPLSKEALQKWEELYTSGQKAEAEHDAASAIRFYEQAYAVDPTFAELNYKMGKLYLKTGELEKAKRAFVEAKDNDVIIFRAHTELQNFLREKSQSAGFPLLETEKFLVSEAPGGILGFPVIEDNAHFSIKGHALIGRALADEMAQLGWLAPKQEWRFERERSYDEISRALGVDDLLIFSAYIRLANYFGSRYESRHHFIDKAMSIFPEDLRAWRYRAWTYFLEGKKDQAEALYRKLESMQPGILLDIFGAQPKLQAAFPHLVSSLSPVPASSKAA